MKKVELNEEMVKQVTGGIVMNQPNQEIPTKTDELRALSRSLKKVAQGMKINAA